MTNIIVPIKDLSQAKQRLSGVLTKEHCEGLVLAMLEDLLITLSTLPSCTVWVLASNTKVFQVAQRCGVRIINEHESQGYNQAVAFGFKHFPGEPVAVIPGDVPLASAAEILQLIKPTHNPEELVRLAPDREMKGTNGLFLSQAHLMESSFGVRSYDGYLRTAKAKGIGVEKVFSTGLALDIDTPADLEQLVRQTQEGETIKFLKQSGRHFGPQFLNQGAA